MTLCIAAIAREKGIVAVSDMRFDLGFTSGDGMPKIGRLNRFWAAMFAGSDVGNAPALLANISDALDGVSDASRKQVETFFRDEYRAALDQRIEALVLSPYKFTVNEFTRTGSKRFTPEVFAKLCLDMAAVEVPYEFLVFGFDEKRKPHLFRVHKGGQIEDCRAIGFWAIGSGDVAAVHHMFFLEYNTGLPLRTTAYYACAAKYFAERASLGERTHVVCLMKDGRLIGIDEKKIRKLWHSSGRARVPRNVWDRLPAFYDIEGKVKPSDDVKIVIPAGQITVVGDWISSAIRVGEISGGHIPSSSQVHPPNVAQSGFTSGPSTPIALAESEKRKAKRPTRSRTKRDPKGQPPSQE